MMFNNKRLTSLMKVVMIAFISGSEICFKKIFFVLRKIIVSNATLGDGQRNLFCADYE